MKFAFTTAFLLGVGALQAQNVAPSVSNVSATVDTVLKKVTVNFSVTDAENDPLEITFAASDNSGQNYFVNASAVTGDVGYPVTPGPGKQLVWDYSALTGVSGNYTLKVLANDRQTVPIQQMVDQVDTLRLRYDMGLVEGKRHYTAAPQHLTDVKDTIFSRFGAFGLAPYAQSFTYQSFLAENIIGQRSGEVHEDTMYIVDGHYDSVSNGPGADDNGSAVIGVLEAARILSQYQFKKTIRFIGFSMEEQGCKGSIQYVTNGLSPKEKVDGVLNFEMIGYYSDRNNSQEFPAGFSLLFPAAYATVSADTFKGNFITNVANTASSPLKQKFDQCAATYVPALKVVSIEAPGNAEIAQDLRRSDHAPFWDGGMKALMITDGAEFRNNNYHTAFDVSDSLNFGFIQNVVKATVGTLAELAEPIHAGHATADVTLPNVTAPASLADAALSEELRLLPNPADDRVSVGWNTPGAYSRITVTDMAGHVVYNAPVAAAGTQHTVMTDGFAPGMYVIRLNGKAGSKTIRLMVKH